MNRTKWFDNPRRPRKLHLPERIEQRRCLSATVFVEHPLFESDLIFPTDAQVVDIDSDGDQDVLVAADNGIFAYENLDGRGTFGDQRVISDTAFPFSFALADVDGDGHKDLVYAMFSEDRVVMRRNIDDTATFGAEIDIANIERPRSVEFADFDRDGDLDLITISASEVAWLENLDGAGQFRAPEILVSIEFGYLEIGDLDGDGLVDLVTGSSTGMNWIRNNGNGFDSPFLIRNEPIDALVVSDVDGDGNLEIIISEWLSQKVVWYDHQGGRTEFTTHEFEVVGGIEYILATADVDHDGDQDFLTGPPSFGPYRGPIRWHENVDGKGNVGATVTILSNISQARGVSFADLDGDGHRDILAVSRNENRVFWQSSNGKGEFKDPQNVNDPFVVWSAGWGVERPDGGMPIIVASPAATVIYEDVNHLNDTYVVEGSQYRLDFPEFMTTDVNSDGNADLFLFSKNYYGPRLLLLYLNEGNGELTDPEEIELRVGQVLGIAEFDFDGDGDPDYVVSDLNQISWLENDNAQLNVREETLMTPGTYALASGDVDGDGDTDLLAADFGWMENNGGKLEEKGRAISGQSLSVGDLDGDGDLDIVTSTKDVVWYENGDGRGGFLAPWRLTETSENVSVDVVDVDGDGDLDIVTWGRRGVYWHENVDGKGTFAPEEFAFGEMGFSILDTDAADADNDGDLDFMVTNFGRLAWYENRIIGDSNDDRTFDSADLVAVFSAAKFESGLPATFDEGDWNQDGVFNTADLVLAFQSDHYVPASTTRVNDLAAAIDGVFADVNLELARIR